MRQFTSHKLKNILASLKSPANSAARQKAKKRARRLEVKPRECQLEYLESREVLAAAITDVDLELDGGSSSTDLVSQDPRLSVTATGPLSDPTGFARLEFDHDGDGTAEGFLDVGALNAVVVYDPRIADPALPLGPLSIKYRALEFDGSDQLVATQNWGTFSFFHAASNAPEIAVLENSIDLTDGLATVLFPNAQQGTPVDRAFTVKNQGGSPLFVHSQIQLPRGFSLLDSINSSTLAPGASDTFTIRLNAGTVGEYGGDVIFFNGDSSESPFSFRVDGSVVAPEVQVLLADFEIENGGSVEFGSVGLSSPLTRTFQVKNNGNGILNLGSVTVPSGYTLVSGLGDSSLDPQQTTTFQVRLDAGSAGEYAGQISVATNDNDESPFQFTVQGSVDRPEIEVLLATTSLVSNDSTIEFGATLVGQQVQQLIEVKNVGTQSLTVSSASVSSGFTISSIPSGGVVAPGNSFTLTVSYAANSAGTQQGVLTLSSTDSNEGTFTINITGTAYEFQSLALLNDTGSSQTDEITTDPRILAVLAGGDPSEAALVEVDIDFDGNADELLEPDAHGRYIYDPSPAIGTSLSWNFRVVVHNDVLEEDRYGSWSNVDFTRTTDDDNDPSVTSLALVNDTGSSNSDTYTADPTISGVVQNDGSAAYLVVYVDLDSDGITDDEVETDETGHFEYRPLGLELGSHSIQFSTYEQRWRGGVAIGAWESFAFTLIAPIAPQIQNIDLVTDTGYDGDNSTLDSTLTGNVVSEEGSTSFEIQFDHNGDGEVDGSAASLPDGSFFYSPDLAAGSYTIWTRAKDLTLDVLGSWNSFYVTIEQLSVPLITEYELFADTGDYSWDLVTSNPTVVGSVTHDLGAAYRTIEFDWDGDQVADGETLTGADGTFAFTPVGLDVGSVTVAARTKIYDPSSGDTLIGNWTNLSFTLEERTGGAIDQLGLANDTGTSNTDNVTTDPTITGTIVSDGPVAYVLVEFDLNEDGIVDGSTRTNEVGEFTFRPAGLAIGEVVVQSRVADWDAPSGDFLISAWESLDFILEDDPSVDSPPPLSADEAMNQADDVASVVGGGYKAGINDAVGAYNSAIGSAIISAGLVDLHIGSYSSSLGTLEGTVPGFGSFGYESGAFSAGTGGSPISFGGPAVPTPSSYSNTIIVSSSAGGVTISGTLVASSIVTVNTLLQTFVIDVGLSYSYVRTEVNGYTSVVTGWWDFNFYATGGWTDIGGVIEVAGLYTVNEDGGHTASYNKSTPYSYSGPDGTQSGTLSDTASSSFSFSHGETGGTFSIDQTGVYGGANFVRTQTSSHSLSHGDSSSYTASGPGASRNGSLEFWYVSDYGLTQGENGSYDLAGYASTYSVDSFVRDENGTYESFDSDSASYTVQFLDGEIEGNFSVQTSDSYSYSRHEEGNFQNAGATVNVTLFTHDEAGTSELSQSASAGYEVNQTNYSDNASYTLVDVSGGGFTYSAEGSYTVDGGGASVVGTSFSLSSSTTNSYEFDGSGSFSQSTALEDRQGPYSLSHSTSSSVGMTDSGSFAIDGSGLTVDGTTGQTATLSSTFSSSSSASYSNSLSAGNISNQQSGWYSNSYVDSMGYSSGGAFSASGSYTVDQKSYAVNTTDGDYSYTRSQSYGDVEHNENGTHSASFHDGGSYTVSGSSVDKTGTFNLTEVDTSTNEETETTSYTKTATPTTTSGTLTVTHSGSTSSSFVDSGTYSNASVSGSFTHDKVLITEAHLDDDGTETGPSRTTDFTKNDDSTVSSSYHYSGNYTDWSASRTSNGDFTLDEKEDTTASYSGSYSYSDPSSSGLVRVETTDTVASTLSESGTYDQGSGGESRSASFSLHQISNGTNSTSDSGTYTDTLGGTYRALSESDTSITLDEDGSYSYSPSSAESRSYSFSQTTTAETTNDSGSTRPFVNTTAEGTKTETVTGSKTSTQTETGSYTRTSELNTRSASFTLTEDGEATTSVSETGNYNNGDIGSYTDTINSVVNSSLSENGTLTNSAGVESRSATFTETQDTTTDVSYTTNYTFIELDSEGATVGTYNQDNKSHKEASQSENGSYTRTASGENRTASRVLTEETNSDSTYTREGVAVHSEGTDNFKTTQDGYGNESYSESGSYTQTPSSNTGGGSFTRSNWNMNDVTKNVTTSYAIDIGGGATKSGTRTKTEDTFRLVMNDETGTFTSSGSGVNRSGSFNDFETSDTKAKITDSGSIDSSTTSSSSSFSESQTSTQSVDVDRTGTFNETPTQNSRSYSFDYDRDSSASTSYSESGSGAGSATGPSSGFYGWYGGNNWNYHWLWSVYGGYEGGGGTGTRELRRVENGLQSSSYHEDGTAETVGGETITANGNFTETDRSTRRRSVSTSVSSSYDNSASYSDHSSTSTGSGSISETETFSETSSYSASGTFTVTGAGVGGGSGSGSGGGSGSGSGSGGGSSSGSGGPGEMTRSASGSFSHSEWDETRFSKSGSFSGSASSSTTDGATFSGQGSRSETESQFDSKSYRESGSFTQITIGEGGGSSSSSGGGDFDTVNSSHTKIESASHSYSSSGAGDSNGLGVGSGSSSGSGSSYGPPTFNANWGGTETQTFSHSYSTSGTIDEDRTAGTSNNSGSYTEQTINAHSISQYNTGSESDYGSNHDWNHHTSGSTTTTYSDNGSYDAEGVSTGTEVTDDYGGSGWSTYHNYNGSSTSSSSSTPNTSDPQTTNYPAQNSSGGSSEQESGESSWLDWVQTGLDIVGFVDPIGIADGLNAVIHLARGNYADAAISAAGMIPYVGDAAKAAKYAAKGVKAGVKLATTGAKMGAKAAGKAASAVVDVARKGAKLADNAVRNAAAAGRKALNKAGELANDVACRVGLKTACFIGDTHVLVIDENGEFVAVNIASSGEDAAAMPPWSSSVFWLGLGVGGYLVLNRKRSKAQEPLGADGIDEWIASRSDDLPEWLEPDEDLEDSVERTKPSWSLAYADAESELVFAGSDYTEPFQWRSDQSSEQYGRLRYASSLEQSATEASSSIFSWDSSANRYDKMANGESTDESTSDGGSRGLLRLAKATDVEVANEAADFDGDALSGSTGESKVKHKSSSLPRWTGIGSAWLGGVWLSVCIVAALGSLAWFEAGKKKIASGAHPVKPVATDSGKSPEYLSIPIRDVQVGQRVPANNPELSADSRRLEPAISQIAWKKLTFASANNHGGTIRVELLRPEEWIEEHQAKVGSTIDLGLDEFGATGQFVVQAVENAPALKSGQGSLVTGKFIHVSDQVLDVLVEGLDDPIGVTVTHPFWSADQQRFIPAGELEPGERLVTFDGKTLPVISITPRNAPEVVYNLEVSIEHVYYVTSRGILVHNACPKQGLYVLYDPKTKRIFYVGRGDVAARGAKHKVTEGKEHLKQLEIFDNSALTKAQAKGMEQRLIDHFGGASKIRSTNGITNLLNKIRSYAANRTDAAAKQYRKQYANDDLWNKTLDKLKSKELTGPDGSAL